MANDNVLPEVDLASENSLRYWLALLRVPECGAIGCQRLWQAWGDITKVFTATTAELLALGLSPASVCALRHPPWEAVEQDLAWLQADAAHHILTWQDSRYPPLLREIADPPPVLFVRGDPALLAAPQLAVVGSRNPTPMGLELTRFWVTELVAAGWVITSGLALGIDAAAHDAAVLKGGKTLAVMGNGLYSVYPRRHQHLADAIITSGGALVSEFLLHTPPKPENFPRRNRIVSGLCLGTLVMEASLRSGSLITARLAAEQGREVFSVPGSVHNPLARGCHFLIRQGAKLVESVAEVLEELPVLMPAAPNIARTPPAATPLPALDEAHAKLLECIAHEVTPLDLLLTRSGKSITELATMLVQLQLQGYVAAVQGGYRRVQP